MSRRIKASGLAWSDVRQLIEERLGDLPGVEVVLYAPTVRKPGLENP